jgi:hypothetical protein
MLPSFGLFSCMCGFCLVFGRRVNEGIFEVGLLAAAVTTTTTTTITIKTTVATTRKKIVNFVMLFIASFNPFGRSKIQQSQKVKLQFPLDLNSGAKR